MANKNARSDSPALRILMLGDACVGKSSLILRYAADEFNDVWMTTIGIDFRVIDHTHKNQHVKVQIWDTAGQERFRSISKAHWKQAHGVMLVYAVDDESTFNNCKKWIEDITASADPNINLVLVGNKCDNVSDRQVQKEDGRKLADEHKIPFFEVSAKKNIAVAQAYESLVNSVCIRVLDAPQGGSRGSVAKGQNVSLATKTEPAAEGGCCK